MFAFHSGPAHRGAHRLNALGLLVLLIFLTAVQFACKSEKAPDKETAEKIISSRTLGLAFLEENRLQEAEAEFKKVTELAPDEALGFANLGLVYLRQGKYKQAEELVRKALDLDEQDADIRLILSEILDVTNRPEEARRALEKALEFHPAHVKCLYALADFHKNATAPGSLQQAEVYLTRLVQQRPGNLAARLQLVEVLLRNEKADSALANLEEIRRQMPELPREAQPFFARAISLLQTGDAKKAFSAAVTFHNFMKLTPLYQASIQELKGPGGAFLGAPVLTFSRDLTTRPASQEAILAALEFTDASALAGLEAVPARRRPVDPFREPGTIFAVADFDGDGHEDIYASASDDGGNSKRFLFKNDIGQFIDITAEAGIRHSGTDLSAIFADYNNDGYLDLFITNSRQNELYRNVAPGKFANATAGSGLEKAAASQKALFADLDHDSDIDLFLCNPGHNAFYRNNLDGTFVERAAAMGLRGPDLASRDAAFADFDEDGDLDLCVVNAAGAVQLFSNLRQGQFEDVAASTGLGGPNRLTTVAAADYNNDGFVDLFLGLQAGGGRFLMNGGSGHFRAEAQAGAVQRLLQQTVPLDAVFLDFDNDGFIDLFLAGVPVTPGGTGRHILLLRNDGSGAFQDQSALLPESMDAAQHATAFDYNEDGDLDLLLSGLDGRLHLWRNDGGNANKYLKVKLVGIRTGSGKNNHFGIGSKVEVKAGDLYQMRVVTSPLTHFGLGQRLKADVVRILWPNGTPQNLFYPGSDQDLVEQQTLKGSCAFLYVWNGEQFEFHTDIMWRSALGMPLGIMGGESAFAAPASTDEYELIPGRKLRPKNGRYVLQVTEELWELAYVDQLRLVAVDHPDSVDVFVDEKFTPPPFPPHRLHVAGRKYLPAAAVDQDGRDVLAGIIAQDDKYIANLKPGRYQGITALHDLLLDLNNAGAKPAKLFLHGWLFPTDASINVAVAQSSDIETVPPYLQVVDAHGAWRTVRPAMGFPMGKNKTMVVDLQDVFLTDDYRVRIRTNMEIYWDYIFFTTEAPDVEIVRSPLAPVAADLHYRGFSKLYRKGGRYGPHWFDYSRVSTRPMWRDLTGDYTRYGDVQELLQESDDRYVIMNAGDEMTVSFDAGALPSLRPGWRRDFLIYSDGWIKDGDLNTARGQTVAPLPFHALKQYPYGADVPYPAALQAYNKKYNTRKVTTEAFRRLLQNR